MKITVTQPEVEQLVLDKVADDLNTTNLRPVPEYVFCTVVEAGGLGRRMVQDLEIEIEVEE